MQCAENTLFLTLEQVFGRLKSLSVYRSALKLTGKFFAQTFRTCTGSCFSIKQRRITAAKCACEEFSIE